MKIGNLEGILQNLGCGVARSPGLWAIVACAITYTMCCAKGLTGPAAFPLDIVSNVPSSPSNSG